MSWHYSICSPIIYSTLFLCQLKFCIEFQAKKEHLDLSIKRQQEFENRPEIVLGDKNNIQSMIEKMRSPVEGITKNNLTN